MQDIVALVIPFIALIFFIGITENLELLIEKQIQDNYFIKKICQDSFLTTQRIGFTVIFLMAYLISWMGDWRLFNYFHWYSRYDWADWGMSALAIAAGSNQLQKNFDFINKIPAIIAGISTTVTRNKSAQRNPEEETTKPLSSNNDGSVG